MTGVIEDLVSSARERVKAMSPRGAVKKTRGPDFADALRGKDHLDVIAEFKQKSPSLGAIAARSLPEQVARYEAGGARAISVLTEPTRFGGSYSDLELVGRSVSLPVLMKDFIVDGAQVREAAHLGASAVLLIVRCLTKSELFDLAAEAAEYGLTPLVECHAPKEIERAVDVGGAVVGVNNRDLDTLEIDRRLAPRLLAEVPADRVVVAESGYETGHDVGDVRGIADAVLVGTALMKLDEPASLIREIRS